MSLPEHEHARARDALTPDLWIGDDTPNWRDCARAFPDLATIALDPSRKVDEWAENTLKSHDSLQSYASLFSREKGFWLSCNFGGVADQAIDPIREVAAFYPSHFPWAIAARLRAVAGLPGELRYLAISPWVEEAMQKTALRLPHNESIKNFMAHFEEGGDPTWVGWSRVVDWRLAESDIDAKTVRPFWGAFEFHISSWDLVENAEQRMKNGEQAPDPDEEPPMREMLAVFAPELFAAMERDLLWNAGPAMARNEADGVARWGEDDYPRCFDAREAMAAAFEACDLQRVVGDAAASDGQLASEEAEPAKAKRRL